MKNLFKHIGIYWYLVFDKTGFLYSGLKTLDIRFRVLFYLGFLVFSYVVMIYLGKMMMALLTNEAYLYYGSILGQITFYAVLFFTVLLMSYEAIYDEDMPKLLEMRKAEKSAIKKEKKQFWRLRNMRFLTRLVLFVFTYYLLLKFLDFQATIAFIDTYPNHTSYELEQFVKQYEYVLKWFTLIYFILALSIEVSAQRKAK